MFAQNRLADDRWIREAAFHLEWQIERSDTYRQPIGSAFRLLRIHVECWLMFGAESNCQLLLPPLL